MLNIVIERNLKSYDFKVNPKAPSSFANNWKNNSIDWFVLFDDNAEICRFKCQSVANYCFGDYATADTVEYGDTIHEGFFKIKCFVEPRSFHGEIHGIIETKDIDGQWINRESMQTTKGGLQNGRFLIHDRYSFNTNSDTNKAWSAGCIILSSLDLETFNTLLKAYEIKAGDIIEGQIVEV
jgi:hypothetical protein